VGEQLLASQEGLGLMELVSNVTLQGKKLVKFQGNE
jgi:hypothetical protein